MSQNPEQEGVDAEEEGVDFEAPFDERVRTCLSTTCLEKDPNGKTICGYHISHCRALVAATMLKHGLTPAQRGVITPLPEDVVLSTRNIRPPEWRPRSRQYK